MPITVERATQSLTLYDMLSKEVALTRNLFHIITYNIDTIVVSFLTVIMKLPDSKKPRISVDTLN